MRSYDNTMGLLMLAIGSGLSLASTVGLSGRYEGHLTHNEGYCTNCALSLTVTDGSSSEWAWKWDHDSSGKPGAPVDQKCDWADTGGKVSACRGHSYYWFSGASGTAGGVTNCSACSFEDMCAAADTPGDCHWCGTAGARAKCYAKGTPCPAAGANGTAAAIGFSGEMLNSNGEVVGSWNAKLLPPSSPAAALPTTCSACVANKLVRCPLPSPSPRWLAARAVARSDRHAHPPRAAAMVLQRQHLLQARRSQGRRQPRRVFRHRTLRGG